jgi:TonB family protein
MRRALLGVSIGLVALALSTSALALASDVVARASVITRPEWLEKPTGDDMERFFPAKARAASMSGRATITCTVTAEGLLKGCVATKETPEGYGFGEAAVSLGAIFRLKPKLVDGQPVEGGTITMPIVFQAPPDLPGLGDMAMVLTRVGTTPPVVAPPVQTPPGLEAPTIPCPDGDGICQGHDFMWLEAPTAQQSARMVAETKPVGGTTFAVCTITTEGLLDGCAYSGDLTPRNEATMRGAVKLLRAPYKTADGLGTALATVIIPFQWDWLTGAKTMGTEATP